MPTVLAQVYLVECLPPKQVFPPRRDRLNEFWDELYCDWAEVGDGPGVDGIFGCDGTQRPKQLRRHFFALVKSYSRNQRKPVRCSSAAFFSSSMLRFRS